MRFFLTIFTFFAVLLCGCGVKFTIVKRVHGDGYYVQRIKKNNLKSCSPLHQANIKVAKVDARNAPGIDPDHINIGESQKSVYAYAEPETIKQHSVSSARSVYSEHSALGIEVNSKKFAFVPIPTTVQNEPVKPKWGTKLLWIILCLMPILSLIPVYLHDGKRKTMNFWVTLILHLTLLGFAVFALLVVCNVVDLS